MYDALREAACDLLRAPLGGAVCDVAPSLPGGSLGANFNRGRFDVNKTPLSLSSLSPREHIVKHRYLVGLCMVVGFHAESVFRVKPWLRVEKMRKQSKTCGTYRSVLSRMYSEVNLFLVVFFVPSGRAG